LTPEIFAEWLRRQGYRVIRTESSYWYNQGPRIYQAFPYHWTIQPSEKELRELLLRERAIGIRYSSPLDTENGKVSYHVIFDSGPYNLEILSAKVRNYIRRGQKHCRVERISIERLAREGWKLQNDTLKRQNRIGAMNESRWQRICLAAKDLAGFEAWGAIMQGELGASIMIARINDACYILYHQSYRQYFNYYVNNALSYAVSHELLSRDGVRTIFYGLHSLDAPASMDKFKFRMGYRAKPVRQRIVFHPWLSPFFNRASHAVVYQLLRWRAGHPALAKVEGMLRFCLDGKLPLEEQPWPPVLQQQLKERKINPIE
jgi:hypothetical protein